MHAGHRHWGHHAAAGAVVRGGLHAPDASCGAAQAGGHAGSSQAISGYSAAAAPAVAAAPKAAGGLAAGAQRERVLQPDIQSLQISATELVSR